MPQTRVSSSTPMVPTDSTAASCFLKAASSSPASHINAEACLPDKVAPSMLSI